MTASAWSPSATTAYTNKSSNQSRSVLGAVADSVSDSATSPSKMKPVEIALIAVVGVLGAGYIVLAALFFWRRNHEKRNRSYVRPGMQGRALIPTFDTDVSDDKPYDPDAALQKSYLDHTRA